MGCGASKGELAAAQAQTRPARQEAAEQELVASCSGSDSDSSSSSSSSSSNRKKKKKKAQHEADVASAQQRGPEKVAAERAAVEKVAAEKATAEPAIQAIVGRYECSAYVGTSNENSWHHATIAAVPVLAVQFGGAPLRWKNKAGVEWSLTPSGDSAALAVGDDCPYFTSGYASCAVECDSDGRVTAVFGPGGERYCRTGDLTGEELHAGQVAWDASAQSHGPKVIRIAGSGGGGRPAATAFIMPVSSKEPDWRDFAYLAAIPTSSHLNGQAPVVLVPHDTSTLNDDSLSDFLGRYHPSTVTIYGTTADVVIEGSSTAVVIYEVRSSIWQCSFEHIPDVFIHVFRHVILLTPCPARWPIRGPTRMMWFWSQPMTTQAR